MLTTQQTKQSVQTEEIASTAGSAVIAGFGDLANGIVRYITNVAMTHMVEPAIYGAFNEVYTAMIILGWIAKLGLDGVLIMRLPIYRVKGRQDLINGLLRFSLWLTLLTGLLVGAAIFISAQIIARTFYHNPAYSLYLQEIALLIPLSALQWIYSAGLQGCKQIKWKVYVDRLSQPALTLLMMLILYLRGWRLEALSLSTIAGFLCSILLGQLVLNKTVQQDLAPVRPAYEPRVWLATAFPMLFNGLIYGVLNSADVLFLSVFATSVQAAIYIAANRVSNFVVTPLVALNMIFSPMIAEYHVQGQHEQLAMMVKLVNKWSLSLSLPVFLACLVFHDAILGIFGEQYQAGGLALIILCTGNIINAGTGSVLQLLAMTGRLRIVSFNSCATIVINILLSLLLVPRFNIIGAAVAAAMAVVVLNILCLVQVYWLMQIHPYRWDICKPLGAGAAAYLTGNLLLHFIHIPPGRFAHLLGLTFLIPFGIVYLLVMFLLRFSSEDQIVLNAIRARFTKK